MREERGVVSRLRDACNVNLADIIDPVAKHGEPFQAITDAHRGVSRWIAAEMVHDPVREYAQELRCLNSGAAAMNR